MRMMCIFRNNPEQVESEVSYSYYLIIYLIEYGIRQVSTSEKGGNPLTLSQHSLFNLEVTEFSLISALRVNYKYF
jgi:hypothetical protein